MNDYIESNYNLAINITL